jgi:deoxyribonuclease-4
MKIGAHVSMAKSLDLAIDRAVRLGVDCIQIHGQSPRTWRKSRFSKQQIEFFNQKAKKHNISPIFIHGIYLVNLATPDKKLLKRSIDSLIHFLNLASKINAKGVIFHLGSGPKTKTHDPLDQAIRAMKRILAKANKRPYLIPEFIVKTGNRIGDLDDLKTIKQRINSKRIRFCLDICHLFSSGYGLNGKALEQTIKEIDQKIGLKNVVAIHANDSKGGFGSRIDRHENLGQGKIGKKVLAEFVNHPSLKDLPFIIETPGFFGEGSDQKNVAILKSLVKT